MACLEEGCVITDLKLEPFLLSFLNISVMDYALAISSPSSLSLFERISSLWFKKMFSLRGLTLYYCSSP